MFQQLIDSKRQYIVLVNTECAGFSSPFPSIIVPVRFVVNRASSRGGCESAGGRTSLLGIPGGTNMFHKRSLVDFRLLHTGIFNAFVGLVF